MFFFLVLDNGSKRSILTTLLVPIDLVCVYIEALRTMLGASFRSLKRIKVTTRMFSEEVFVSNFKLSLSLAHNAAFWPTIVGSLRFQETRTRLACG